jgi:hypothetical protein
MRSVGRRTLMSITVTLSCLREVQASKGGGRSVARHPSSHGFAVHLKMTERVTRR